MRITIAMVLLLVCSACYEYAPVRTGPMARGAAVRVDLATPQRVRLTDYTVEDVVRVDGEYVGESADTVVLSVTTVRARSGFESLGGGATVRVARSDMAALQYRRFSAVRSAGLGGLLLAGAIGITTVVRGGADTPGGGGSGGSPK